MPRAGYPHRESIRVHRETLRADEHTIRDAIRVTTLTRTLPDLATVLDARALGRAFEESQVLHSLGPAVLPAEAVARNGRRGMRTGDQPDPRRASCSGENVCLSDARCGIPL